MAKKYYPIKAFGFETQAPRWALNLLALVLIAGVGIVMYQKYADPEQQLISLREANQQLAAEIEEYGLHAMEEPEKHELFEDSDGRLALRVFKDHCILIQRQTRRGVKSKLVVDLDRGPKIVSSQIPPPPAGLRILPVVEASAQDPCKRGCLNQHPGAFRWWYGERRGQWVEVWRRWPDGCTHVQLFMPGPNVWDTNPDGTPRVSWRCCVH